MTSDPAEFGSSSTRQWSSGKRRQAVPVCLLDDSHLDFGFGVKCSFISDEIAQRCPVLADLGLEGDGGLHREGFGHVAQGHPRFVCDSVAVGCGRVSS